VQSRDRFVGQAKIKLTNGMARVMIPAFNIPSGLGWFCSTGRDGPKPSGSYRYPRYPVSPYHTWLVDLSASPNWAHYMAAVRAARLRQAENAEQYRFNGARQLKEVVVKAAKLDDDRDARRTSLHGTPDVTAIFKETDNAYPNVFEMMRGKLLGVQVRLNPLSGTYIVIVGGVGSFGGNNAPLFLLDGQYVDQDLLLAINASEIERIELVKNSTAAIYGARGGAGVIAFFRRKWKPDQVSEGAEKLSFVGFSKPSTFTFPVYNADAATQDHTRIDRRDVLLWQPQFQTDAQGQVTLKFPLSDVVRTLRITVQGITATGQPVSVERLIRVQ